MAIPGTIAITGPVAPTATSDVFPTHFAKYGKGGYYSVATLVERDAITVERREHGLRVFVIANSTEYRLESNLTTWTAISTTSGDMLRSVYDTNNDGIVDNSTALNGQAAAYYLNRTNHTGAQAISTITNLQTTLTNLQTDINTKLNASEVGVSVCELVGGFVPLSRINLSPLQWKGTWDAASNNPPLADGTGTNGFLYKVSAAGSQDLGSGTIAFAVGDWVSHNGTAWEKNGDANLVQSVNGQVGIVVLDADDLANGTTNFFLTTDEKDALGNTPNTASSLNWFVTKDEMTAAIAAISFPSGAITSVFGRTGVVTAQANDYTAAQIAVTPSGTIFSGTNVQAVIGEISSAIQALQTGGGGSTVTVGDTRETVTLHEDGTNLSGVGTERLLSSLINPTTGVAYTNTSAATKWPAVATLFGGSINVNTTTYDDVVLQSLMLRFRNGVSKVYMDNRRFAVRLPIGHILIPDSDLSNSNITNYKNRNLCIEGGYSTILVTGTGTNKTIFRRKATSRAQSAAGNQNPLTKRVHLKELVLKGNAEAGGKGLDFWANYNLIVENVDFYNFERSLELRFALNAVIRNCNFEDALTNGYHVYQNLIDSSDWADVSDPGGQTTSQVKLYDNRFSVGQGVTAAYIRGADSAKLFGGVMEVPDGAIGARGFFYDYGGSNNSKGAQVENVHFEGPMSDAYVRGRVAGTGALVVENCYCQCDDPNNSFLAHLNVPTGYGQIVSKQNRSYSGATYKYKYSYAGAVSGVPGGGGSYVFYDPLFNGTAPNTESDILSNSDIFVLTGNDALTGDAFVSPILGRLKLYKHVI
jgi:hypothetical protein